MARLFDDGATQYITVPAPLTGAPFSMGCWFNTNDDTIVQCLMSLADTATANNYHLLLAYGTIGGDPLRFEVLATAAESISVTGTGFTANTWHHACAVKAAADDHAVFIDGGSKGTDATSSTPAGVDTLGIGARVLSGVGVPMSGFIAEAAVWNVALSDAEVAILAEGYSPLLVRPQNLVFYAPLVRELLDVVGGATLTNNNGATVGDHSRVLYPPPPSLVIPPLAAVTAIASQRLKIGVGR